MRASNSLPRVLAIGLLVAISAAALVFIDLFLFRAAIVASLLFLSAIPAGVLFFLRARSRGSATALKPASGVALIFIFVALFGVGAGKILDLLIVENAYRLLATVEQYRNENKRYPSSSDQHFYRSLFHGYPLHYIATDGMDPYIVFDKFNFQRQVLDVRTRTVKATGGL